MRCSSCQAQMVRQKRFRPEGSPTRAELRSLGIVVHCARGLCNACYAIAWREGTLLDVERKIRPNEEVLAEYRLLADPERPVRHNVELIAPRLGMKPRSLERAINRYNARERAA